MFINIFRDSLESTKRCLKYALMCHLLTTYWKNSLENVLKKDFSHKTFLKIFLHGNYYYY